MPQGGWGKHADDTVRLAQTRTYLANQPIHIRYAGAFIASISTPALPFIHYYFSNTMYVGKLFSLYGYFYNKNTRNRM